MSYRCLRPFAWSEDAGTSKLKVQSASTSSAECASFASTSSTLGLSLGMSMTWYVGVDGPTGFQTELAGKRGRGDAGGARTLRPRGAADRGATQAEAVAAEGLRDDRRRGDTSCYILLVRL